MLLSAPVLAAAVLCAAPSPNLDGVRLALTVDGARSDALRRLLWVHEPNDAAFPSLSPGWGGAVAVELGASPANARWLGLFVGARGRVGVWAGPLGGSSASTWDVGLRSRIELTLGPLQPWVGVGSAVGSVTARLEGAERHVVAHLHELSAGLRVRLIGPVALGLFVEALNASSFARPPEEFTTLRLGADVTVTFELGPKRDSSAR
ncbi:MAG: hypothetical protein JNJ54_13160 [Myxococcaceae bacterium]|nr:hypothetical protein [Myxococcaceae bacterium]